ncbi:hypothetical protein IJ425_07090 [bacterium]|nr:hypothetical protein [bacterium]
MERNEILFDEVLERAKVQREIQEMQAKRENEKMVLRMNLLGGMHSYIQNCIDDEMAYDSWIKWVPDEPTEEDLMSIAEKEKLFNRVCAVFGSILMDFK